MGGCVNDASRKKQRSLIKVRSKHCGLLGREHREIYNVDGGEPLSETKTSRNQIHNEDRSWIGVVMILPQVHLRKPCYDFTFL